MTERNSNRAKQMRARIAKTRAVCWLCGEAIDYELRNPHPRAFVIDHVVPIHLGGADDMSNVKAAHRECNSIKRARVVSPIIRRSGALKR